MSDGRNQTRIVLFLNYPDMRTLTVLITIAITRLNAAEYLNLMSRLRVLIETATPEAVGLTTAEFEEFAGLVNKLQRRVNWTSASELTETLDQLDKQRDSLLSLLFGIINSYMSLPDTALGKAAVWLERVTRPYKSIQTDPAQQESVKINGLLLDLDTEEAKAHLETLHLTEQVAELKTINDQYVELTAQRARDTEADKQAPVADLRKQIDPLYEAIRVITLSESVCAPTEVTAEFILGFNATLREVNNLYNIRSGKTQEESPDPVLPGTDPTDPDDGETTDPDDGGGTPGDI